MRYISVVELFGDVFARVVISGILLKKDAALHASRKPFITASPVAMTQHSDASSDRSEVSVTPPPPVSKMLEFASQQNLSFLNLEHRNMLAAPLAALHSMTEMKVQQQSHSSHDHLQHQEKSDTDVLLERTSLHVERSGLASRSPLGATSNSNSSQGANPHGIDHILSRPSQITTGPLHFPHSLGFSQNSLGMATNSSQGASNSGLRGFNIAAAAFFHHHAANSVSKPPMELGRGASGLYWPGFQGLVSNPIAWRDRLNSSMLNSVILFYNELMLGKFSLNRATVRYLSLNFTPGSKCFVINILKFVEFLREVYVTVFFK